MADQRFSIDSFRSKIFQDSLARTNRFIVEIIPPPALSRGGASDIISLYCEQAAIPQLSISTKQQRIFGPAHQRPQTSDYGGDGLPMIFHVDRDMKVRKFFEDWLHLIVSPNDFTVSYQEDYISTINIKQLDERENITHNIQLIEAFPRNITNMELNHASQNQTHRLNVLFAYRYWVRMENDVSNFDLVDTPQSIRYPGVPVQDVRIN